jgi:small subunit ribosomal protein S20
MPIKNAAKKYMRVTDRKTALNKSVKGVLKGTIRKAKESAGEKSKDVTENYKKAQAAIDKAVKRGIIKKNTGARKKSRLNALLKKASK